MAMLPEDRTRRLGNIFRKYGEPSKVGRSEKLDPMAEEPFRRMQRDTDGALFLDPLWRAERPCRRGK
jgi:hypothetical protein